MRSKILVALGIAAVACRGRGGRRDADPRWERRHPRLSQGRGRSSPRRCARRCLPRGREGRSPGTSVEPPGRPAAGAGPAGAKGATGAQGPRARQGRRGRQGRSGPGLASFDSLAGHRVHDRRPGGTISLAYDAAASRRSTAPPARPGRRPSSSTSSRSASRAPSGTSSWRSSTPAPRPPTSRAGNSCTARARGRATSPSARSPTGRCSPQERSFSSAARRTQARIRLDKSFSAGLASAAGGVALKKADGASSTRSGGVTRRTRSSKARPRRPRRSRRRPGRATLGIRTGTTRTSTRPTSRRATRRPERATKCLPRQSRPSPPAAAKLPQAASSVACVSPYARSLRPRPLRFSHAGGGARSPEETQERRRSARTLRHEDQGRARPPPLGAGRRALAEPWRARRDRARAAPPADRAEAGLTREELSRGSVTMRV